MIGLVDYDFQTNTSMRLCPPNLEIMKLANYYKSEQNKYCRLINLNQQQLSGYEKIYFFSQKDGTPKIPEAFLRADNVIFGGTAFTNGEYIPFENQIIQYTMPKINIYTELLHQKYNNGVKSKVISHFLDDTYYRMYAKNNKLPVPPVMMRKRVYLYDIDFFYPDWKDIIEDISARKPASILRIHPIYCNTVTQFGEIRSISKLSHSNDVILDLNVPLDEIYYLFKVYKKMFLANITKNVNVYLPLGGNFKTPIQYRKDLIYKLNLLYSFWSNNIMIKVKYKEANIGIVNPLSNLMKRIQLWANNDTKDINITVYKTTIVNQTHSIHYWFVKNNNGYSIYTWDGDKKTDKMVEDLIRSAN